jgi:hypothetical protein
MTDHPKRVDPPSCGCTDCLTGYSVPLNLATWQTVKAMIHGDVQDATGTKLDVTVVVVPAEAVAAGVTQTWAWKYDRDAMPGRRGEPEPCMRIGGCLAETGARCEAENGPQDPGLWHCSCGRTPADIIKAGTFEEAEGTVAECGYCTARITLLGGSWTAGDGTTACTDPGAPYVPHRPKEG